MSYGTRTICIFVTTVLAVAARAPLHAQLIDNGDGTITDVDVGLMWTAAANPPATWDDAMAWAEGLTLGGHTNWRLPSGFNIDGSGFCENIVFCFDSEMGHLYFGELGPLQGSGFGPAFLQPPMTYMPAGFYWLLEEYTDPSEAWTFYVSYDGVGGQDHYSKDFELFALAVREIETGDPEGACCFDDMSCQVLTEDECGAQSGSYVGDDTNCDPNPCLVAACCFENFSCEVLTEVECTAQGGFYQVDEPDCDPNPCLPPPGEGACCFGDMSCQVLTEDECGAQGGSYQGDGVPCFDPNPCINPGACCFDDGSCNVLLGVECSALGGSFQGSGTACDPNPCPQPVWAVSDPGIVDTQLLTMGINGGAVNAVGPVYADADIEAMTYFGDQVVGAMGEKNGGSDLVVLDFETGTMAPFAFVDFGGLGTEIVGMATDGNGFHWGYFEDVGFATIEVLGGVGTFVVEIGCDAVEALNIECFLIEGLAVSHDGETLYAMVRDGRILSIDVATGTASVLADFRGVFADDDIENLELMSEDELAFITEDGGHLYFSVLNVNSGQITSTEDFLDTGLDDIESLIFPADVATCPPIDFGPELGAPPSDYVILTDQLADCGVLFSTVDPRGVYWIGGGGYSSYTYCISAGGVCGDGEECSIDPIRIDFLAPTEFVSIRCFDGGNDIDTMVLTAYGPGDVVVDVDEITSDFSVPGHVAIAAGDEIVYVTVHVEGVAHGLFFDDLDYMESPMPLGACTYGEGTCDQMSQAACEALNGQYHGDATDCTVLCPADIDCDGHVGVTDFLDVLAAWGPNPGHPADLNGDGHVGVTDFLDLLAAWGPCP